ncbi:MAG: hypothetical protein HYR97_05775 [Candidatus Melainabacteria bacterium]|nr:hypothetical protein [Candidatus Melainabacteria bacterium]MBI3308670.1 hypothetical protein [Candidatus Melainabacteria bacterium]
MVALFGVAKIRKQKPIDKLKKIIKTTNVFFKNIKLLKHSKAKSSKLITSDFTKD